MRMAYQNNLAKTLGIDYPFIQAPMLGVSTPEMAAAVSNAGGLGSVAVGGLSPDKTRELIVAIRALTNKPFAVNLFTHSIPPVDAHAIDKMQDFLHSLCAKHHIPFAKQAPESFKHYTYKDQLQVLLDEHIRLISFTFGIPDAESIEALKANGALLMGTATSTKEAIMLQQSNIDMITAQGIEAGGHRGSFIDDEPLPQIGLVSLLPQVMAAVNLPVIAAGGISRGDVIHAMMQLGAEGVKVGTAFIASPESKAIPAYKAAVQQANDTATTLTRTFSGRWARGIRNAFMDAVADAGIDIPPYPFQNSITTALRAAAQQQNNKDFTNLWAGQSATHALALPSAEIFLQLITEAGWK